KIREAEQWLRQQLLSIYEQSEAAIIADWVMEHLTGCTRSQRAVLEESLTIHQLHHLTEIFQRLQQHEPIQYILNEAHFYGMKLFVNNSVLIPRPETEELIEWIIEEARAAGKDVFHRGVTEADETKKLKILDVGTGSGCIALALKKAMPKAEVWGCDVSEEALNVARRNGSALNIRVDFQGMNFLNVAERKLLPTVDTVVSNPPYVPQKDKATMQPNVVQHEPHVALFVPDDDALVFYKALAQFGKERLYENGNIYCEIHEDLGKEVIDLFKREGYKNAELRKDRQGKDRMVRVTT
ncbi:MAG: peptide chain release factor N(5)-glutamine methyltransferase, partial [Flavisolibacter sp.]|nr:peptide chain release factor N(5)-glutamine methyltransferase [Flavisolibacter sp.]